MSFVLGWGCDHSKGSGWRASRSIGIAGLVAVLVACSAVAALGGSERGVLLDVQDARLANVVVLLSQQSGANIVLNPDVGEKRITAHLNGLPLETVLDQIVKSAGVDYYRTDDGTYMIGSKPPVVPTTAPAVIQPPAAPAPEPVVRKLHTEKVQLMHFHPVDMMIAFGVLPEDASPTWRKFFGVDEATGSKPLGIVVGSLDQDGLHVGDTPRRDQPAGGVRGTETSPPAIDSGTNSRSGGAGRAATPDTGSPQGGRLPGAGGGLPGAGGRPGAGGQTGAAGNLLPEGVDLVMPIASDNSLILRGTDEGIQQFKELVHLLDVPPKQISIKAEFIEVSTNDVKALGIDWRLERLNETINTQFNPTGNVLVGVTTGNVAASLVAELSKGSGKIINSPIISSINNEYAEISIGSQIPYATPVVIPGGVGSNPITTWQISSLNVSTYLRVVPRVNGDGTITLTIMPSVQDTGRIHKVGDQEIPETRYQTLYTRRRVMNGETIVVGGFIRKDQSISVSAVPILGDLPIVGGLFRTTRTSQQDRELLIFVTPTIIGEKSAGTSVGVSAGY